MTSNLNSKLAFIFPGQGSQAVGMLQSFLDDNDLQTRTIIENTFDEANQVLGYDLFALIQNGPDTDLNLTTHTQVAILSASIAIYRVWQHLVDTHIAKNQLNAADIHAKTQAMFMAGHSLGEYSAMCAAGYLSFADTLHLVKFRADSMQKAVPVGIGAMAAILGLSDEVIVETCEKISTPEQVVQAVNFNTAGQVVIAGHSQAVNQAIEALKALGAKRALLLSVSAPFHTSLMQGVADALYQKLVGLDVVCSPVQIMQNINADINHAADEFKKQIAQQAASPVLWSQSIEKLKQKGVTHFVECGYGKVLTGLNKRVEGIQSFHLSSVLDMQSTLEALLEL